MHRSIIPLHTESCIASNSMLVSRNILQTHFQTLLRLERPVAWFVKVLRIKNVTGMIANPWSIINSSRKLDFSKFMAKFAESYRFINWITKWRTEPWSLRFHQWVLYASITNFDTLGSISPYFSYVIGIQSIQKRDFSFHPHIIRGSNK